jgi:starvation-inducible DNA-binding protein
MTTLTATNVSPMKKDEPHVPNFLNKEKNKAEIWKIIGLLNQSLAHTIDLRSRTKQAYWSAKGGNLYTLQKMLNDFSLQLDHMTDKMAARVMALGGIPVRTISNVAAASKLPNYPSGIVQSSDHLDALIQSYESASEHLPDAMRKVVAENDYPSAHVFSQFAKILDEHVSLLAAHIPAEWVESQKKKA